MRFVYADTIIIYYILHACLTATKHACDIWTIICSSYMYHIHLASCILAVASGVWEGTALKGEQGSGDANPPMRGPQVVVIELPQTIK